MFALEGLNDYFESSQNNLNWDWGHRYSTKVNFISAKPPVVTIDEDTEEIVASNTDTFQLKLHNSAVSTTVALFDKYVISFL